MEKNQEKVEQVFNEFNKSVISILNYVRRSTFPEGTIFEDSSFVRWQLGYFEKKTYEIGGGFDTDLVETTSFQVMVQIRIELDQNGYPSGFLCRDIIHNTAVTCPLSVEKLLWTIHNLFPSLPSNNQ